MAARPDLLPASEGGFGAVARKASTPMSLGRCLIRADVGMLVVAEALTVSHPATADELDDLLGTDDLDGVLDALRRLQQMGVVLIEEAVARPVGALSDLLHRPLGLGPSFAELAGHLPADTVEHLAELVGASGASKPSATARAIARRLRTADGLARALDDAPEGIEELLGLLAEQRSPAIGLPAGWLYRQPDREDPLRWLLDRGLVVAVNDGVAELAREVVIACLPDGLAPGAALRPIALRPVEGLDADAVEATAADRAARTLEAAEALVRLALQGDISVRKAGGVGVREIRRLAKVVDLEARDVGRLLELLRWARLIEARPGRPVEATDLAPVWFQLDRWRRWLVLVRTWMSAPVFPSSALAIGLDDKPVPALADHDQIPATGLARTIVLTALAELGAGAAFHRDQLTEVVVWRAPNLWGVGEPPAEELVAWLLDELELLGLVAADAPTSLCRSLPDEKRTDGQPTDEQPTDGQPTDGQRTDGVAGVDVEEAAARFLGGEQEQFVLQADLTAVALGPLAPAVAGTLGDLADRQSGLTIPTFRFSESSLRRAFDVGWTSDSIEEFLAAHALSGLPQPLRYLIGDVARRYGSVRVLAARSVIVTSDEAEAVEIATTVRAARIGLRLIAPTVLISPLDPHQMVDELRAEGLFPVLDGATISLGRQTADHRAAPGRAGGDGAIGPGGQATTGVAAGGPSLPADWVGADLGDQVLPDEVTTAVEVLLDETAADGPSVPTPRSGLEHRFHLVWNRPAVVTHLRNGELVESTGVLVSVDDSLALLGDAGVEELPIEGVISIEDPNR